jgi:hypothetical protein
MTGNSIQAPPTVLEDGYHAVGERSEPVRARIDRGAQVRLEAQPETPRDGRRGFVPVEEHHRTVTFAQRHRDPERHFGDATPSRSVDGDECRGVVDRLATGRDRGRNRCIALAFGRASEPTERDDELGECRVGGHGAVDAHRDEVVLARWFLGIKDTEHSAAAPVHGGDQTMGERRPAIAHDEDVVVLVERDRRLDDDLTDASTAVMSKVTMELLDPRLRREDQRDGRLPRRHRPPASPAPTRSSVSGSVPRADAAPVVRAKEISPSATAAATDCDCFAVTAIVTVNGLDDSPMPPRPRASTARTGASATMIDTAC